MFKENGFTVEELIKALQEQNVPKDYEVKFTTAYRSTVVRDWYINDQDKEIVLCD